MQIEDYMIQTPRFILRPLTVSDATQDYLQWMRDEVVLQFITGASRTQTLASLEEYILEKANNENCILFGIFERLSNTHIGNIKYEPICLDKSEAVMGVLIGDPAWRGKQVFSEVFEATQDFLAKSYSIRKIRLGVDSSNIQAIKAYQKMGFIAQSLSDGELTPSIEMIYEY